MADKSTPTTDTTKKNGASKARSPAYPSIDLENAVEKARKLHGQVGRAATNFSIITQVWGYGPKSGNGRMAFAALKKFGLLEVKGEGSARTGRLTEDALRIVLDTRPDSAERRTLLQRAALRPTAHRNVWERYRGALPSDEVLRMQLQLDGYTASGAADFLAELRSTLAYAKVDASTTIQGAPADDDEDEDLAGAPDTMDGTRNPPSRTNEMTPPPPPPPGSGPRVSFPLAGGNVLEVSLRSRVSKKEFDKIKKILDLAEDSFIEDGAESA